MFGERLHLASVSRSVIDTNSSMEEQDQVGYVVFTVEVAIWTPLQGW